MSRSDKRICTNCGATNLGFHEACPICKTPLPKFPAGEAAVTMVSQPSPPSTRASPPPQPVVQRPVQTTPAAPGRSSGRRTIVIIVAVVVLLCLCSCACVLMARSGTFGTEASDVIHDVESFFSSLFS